VAEDGLGKRTSAYEDRVAGRGGQGIGNMELSRAGGRESRVVGAFWVLPSDQLVLVTNAGKLIRCPVDDIRIAGRATRGVRLFDVAEGERIVSAARLTGEATEEDGDDSLADGEEA
jgi:DNA gyrase subunit A